MLYYTAVASDSKNVEIRSMYKNFKRTKAIIRYMEAL